MIHDGSPEVLAAFPEAGGQQGDLAATTKDRPGHGRLGKMGPANAHTARVETEKSASRFFYCAKTSKTDRNGGLEDPNNHPTVKPTSLMQYLVRLITPPGGVVLDPFMGSGSTGKACVLEGFGFIGVEKEPAYLEIAKGRIGDVKP